VAGVLGSLDVTSRFETDTAVTPRGDGRYRACMDLGWWIVRGPNGGYVAATILRAILAELDDPARPPRSFTVHYLRPPVEGDVDIAVTTERAGRSLTTLSARLEQGGKLLAVALCACATDQTGPAFDDIEVPAVAPPDELPVPPPAMPQEIPMRARYEQRWAIGAPPNEANAEALADVGGWIRLADPHPVDHTVVAALTDAWPPAAFNRMTAPAAVPTVDLTIHFREQPPDRPEWCLVRFTSRLGAHGFVEEDGEVWSADGKLLAQSRQLAVVLPMTPG
jgi:acyl-CoA thioesterase